MWRCTKMGNCEFWLGLKFWKMVNQEASGSHPARFCTSYPTQALWLDSYSLIPSATVLLVQQQHITDKDIILKWVHQFFLCSISHAWTDTDIILIAEAERSRGVVLGGAQVPSAVTDLARLGSFDQRGGGGECQEGPPLWRLNVDLQVHPPAMSLSSFWSFDQREGGDECLNALRHWFLFLVFFFEWLEYVVKLGGENRANLTPNFGTQEEKLGLRSQLVTNLDAIWWQFGASAF